MSNAEQDEAQKEADRLIEDFRCGRIDPVQLGEKLLAASFSTISGVTADIDRLRRTGFPEVVYGEGKPIDKLVAACERLLTTHHREILVTRVNVEQARHVCDQFPFSSWNSRARTIRIGHSAMPLAWNARLESQEAEDFVAVVSAGTTDSPVAEEALETLGWMQVPTIWVEDVGVAGPHRLLSRAPLLRKASAIVVVAGMEGALASVVAGHVGVPIFAVPTSIGYGVNFSGLTPLLTMLNSCASNVATVGVDAGFRGGYLAGLVYFRGIPQKNPARD
jgi:pyridinium-3,5-biscarboxylic acid mononucleotide synthase